MAEGGEKYKKDFIFLIAAAIFFILSFGASTHIFSFLSWTFVVCEMGYIFVKTW